MTILKMTNRIRTSILCLVLTTSCENALSEGVPPSAKVLQEITTLSSQQFYTQFALVRSMLEGSWDEEVFEQFSFYDGINRQLMIRYGELLRDDKKWGPFLEMKNSLHTEAYKKLLPLIEKRRNGGTLTDTDRKLLEALDEQILQKLIKGSAIKPMGLGAAEAGVLEIFESKLETDPEFLTELLAEDRDRAERLLRTAQKQRPAARPWALYVQVLFAFDIAAGRALQGKKRIAHFKHALEYLQETHDVAVKTLGESPDETLETALPGLRLDLALAALEAGELELAKKRATETLDKNTDRESWNFGNTVHDANQILGLCALREESVATAKKHLLAAGTNPGSPQLNSFGPDFRLARELLERGEKETVLKYLDLVARFWANPDERREENAKGIAREHLLQLETWKNQVREGEVPNDPKWLPE